MQEKVGLDVITIPTYNSKNRLVVARCDVSGYPEARALRSATAQNVAKFLFKDVICRHGVFSRLVTDSGPENKELLAELVRTYRIKYVTILAYNSKVNGIIEQGHILLEDTLSKIYYRLINNQEFHLPLVIQAKRITIRTTTRFSPFYLEFSRELYLPIKGDFLTWRTFLQETVKTTADLLALRARQFQRKDSDLKEAVLAVQRYREASKETYNAAYRTRTEGSLIIGDLVLLYNIKLDANMSLKLEYRQIGPYRIVEAIQVPGIYVLAELDSTQRAGIVTGNRLKHFWLKENSLGNLYEDLANITGTLTRIYQP